MIIKRPAGLGRVFTPGADTRGQFARRELAGASLAALHCTGQTLGHMGALRRALRGRTIHQKGPRFACQGAAAAPSRLSFIESCFGL